METGPVSVQAVTRPDFGMLIGWADSPSTVHRWAGGTFEFPLDEAQLKRYLSQNAPSERLRFTASIGGQGNGPVGYFELREVDHHAGSAYLSLVLVAPRFRGRGVGTAMLETALEKCFYELGLHRVGVRVLEENEAALAWYEKLGFVREGVLREALREAGGFGSEHRDLVVLSVLEHEWRRRHDPAGSS